MHQNIFNDDFQDFIRALNEKEVAYLLVGGYSVIIHGYSRTTGDLDIWVQPTTENYEHLLSAFRLFGMPVFDMTEGKFMNTKQFDVFTFGRPPISIDILTKVKGLTFENAFEKSMIYEMEDDFFVRVITKNDLLKAKKSAGRKKDLADIEALRKVE